MLRKYIGNKKSIEARSDDRGHTWSVKLFDCGRLTKYSKATLAEVDKLAADQGMVLAK